MKQTYTFRFTKENHDKLKREASKLKMSISAYLESLVTAKITPATQEEIIDQVVADMPSVSDTTNTPNTPDTTDTLDTPAEGEVIEKSPVEAAIAAIREEQLY